MMINILTCVCVSPASVILRIRYWYRPDVCLSVCLSVRQTLVLCWNGSILIYRLNCLNSLPGSGSPMILVFWRSCKLFPGIPMGIPPTGALNARGRKKVAISDQYLAIVRKRLKIDGYMLRCVWLWPALNPLSIHVTFTAIVPGAYPGYAKKGKR